MYRELRIARGLKLKDIDGLRRLLETDTNTDVERDKLYLSLPNHKKSAELVFLTLISYRKIYQATYFIECLEKIITYQDMFATICLNFSKKIIAHIESGSDDLSDENILIILF